MIKAEIVADSINQQGDRLTSILCTFPRIILAEVNTHRMLSKNTSSSRAIPFTKMVEAVTNNPFIPIAWQKHHSGMQGTEYLDIYKSQVTKEHWLKARDNAVLEATLINRYQVTKQLCNRLLEPFMWTTMLITGSKEGWDNFFELRCPVYRPVANTTETFKSKKDAEKRFGDLTGVDWFRVNDGQAEIHIMDLAEKIYDAMNESAPKQLNPGEWHIPFEGKIDVDKTLHNLIPEKLTGQERVDYYDTLKVKISTAMAARTSYTVVGDEKEVDYERMIGLHDRLIAQNPPHSSPMEHCARAMNGTEYKQHIKGIRDFNGEVQLVDLGWCRNYKGFIQYRHFIEEDTKS